MRLLLDTHTFLWWITDHPRLSSRARKAIEEAAEIFVSAVTAWEVVTKHRLGKLPDAEGRVARLAEIALEEGMQLLPLSFAQGLRAGAYSAMHRDPFDRMLAAQAELNDLILVTRDPLLKNFPVHTLW